MVVRRNLSKAHIAIIITAVASIILVMLSLLFFTSQVNTHIDSDMRTLSGSMHANNVKIIDHELAYLTNVTQSVATLLGNADIKNDADIVSELTNYANNAGIVRTLFVTLDGHVYTNYAGYLGQNVKDTSIDGIPLSDVSSTYISDPYYDPDLKEVIFGVVAPTHMAGKEGVLVSSYNINLIYALLGDGTTQSETGIVAPNGSIIVGKDNSDFCKNIFDYFPYATFIESSVEKVQEDFSKLKIGSAMYSVDGTSRHCVYSPASGNDWMIVTTVKESVLQSKTDEMERHGTQLTMHISIVMLCLIGVITTLILREQKKARMALMKAARTDGLTGIYNRLAIEEIVTDLLEKKETSHDYAVLIIDLDNFKEINDSKGHMVGDIVLKQCAKLLSEVFAKDIVGRIGGDEFIVFVPCYYDKKQVEEKATAFLDTFYVDSEGENLKISASIGISWGENIHSFNDLYKKADSAMYSAKKSGKGNYSCE